MQPKLFQLDNKDAAWRHAWAERDLGRVGLAFVYAAPVSEATQKAAGLGSFRDIFGDIFGAVGQKMPVQAEGQAVEPPRSGYLLVCWPHGFGLTAEGHSRIASKHAITAFAQADHMILSLSDDAIEQAVELVVSGTAEHRGHMMPPSPPQK